MSCKHKHLQLMVEGRSRLRCNICHLTIDRDELNGGFCPECYALRGRKNYDFTLIEPESVKIVRYRCEGCRLIIEC